MFKDLEGEGIFLENPLMQQAVASTETHSTETHSCNKPCCKLLPHEWRIYSDWPGTPELWMILFEIRDFIRKPWRGPNQKKLQAAPLHRRCFKNQQNQIILLSPPTFLLWSDSWRVVEADLLLSSSFRLVSWTPTPAAGSHWTGAAIWKTIFKSQLLVWKGFSHI